MTLPASGIFVGSGVQEATLDELSPISELIPKPNTRSTAPPMESGAATARAIREASERITPAPKAMQTHPAITVLSRLFWSVGSSATGLGRGARVSASRAVVAGWRVQVERVGVFWYASVAQLGRVSDL